MPSIIVVGLPNFLVSSLMRIRCCSFSISPQTHKSLGSPHVVQTSAMNLILTCDTAIYKDFQVNPDLSGVFLPNFPADFNSEVEKLPLRTRVDAVLIVDHFVLQVLLSLRLLLYVVAIFDSDHDLPSYLEPNS